MVLIDIIIIAIFSFLWLFFIVSIVFSYREIIHILKYRQLMKDMKQLKSNIDNMIVNNKDENKQC